jgi:MoaA/NifB/PqqE/SkfB family radical SAM enzyme
LTSLQSLPRPEPSAGIKAYYDEQIARLAYDSRCRENYARYKEAALRPLADVNYLPVKLDVENVSRCNFACKMCAVSKWPRRQRADDMTLAQFKALIDENYGLVEIKLNGLGEALMQGDDYFEMIRYARERRIWVRMTTNASLLGVRDNYRKLIDSGVNEIDISIDGCRAEVFEKIRVGGNFRIVTENCALLNRYTRELGICRTKMWTLVQKDNYADLYDHVFLAARLGFKHLVFSLQLHGWGDPDLEQRNAGEQVAPDYDYLYGLIEWGNTLGVWVRFWEVAAKFDSRNLCPWPFHRAVVTSDSRVVPCCMIGDPDAFEIKGGWHGEEYRAFRQAHIDGNIPAVCKGCYK